MSNLTPDVLAMGMIWYVVFLFSTTCHEAAHALAAKLGGDLTAFHGGQVTLNPLPHIQREPFGMVLVPIASFVFGGMLIGWASAPYDPDWQRRYPRRAAWMALAGPAANFLLMLLAVFLLRWGGAMKWIPPPTPEMIFSITKSGQEGSAVFVTTLLAVFFFLNLLLGCFNLFPVPPLDGSSGITLLLPRQIVLRYLDFIREPVFSLAGIFIAWWLFGKVMPPIFLAAWWLLLH